MLRVGDNCIGYPEGNFEFCKVSENFLLTKEVTGTSAKHVELPT